MFQKYKKINKFRKRNREREREREKETEWCLCEIRERKNKFVFSILFITRINKNVERWFALNK